MSIALATGVRVRAAIFDFNGTVCDDEGLLYEIVRDILRPHGVDLDGPDFGRLLDEARTGAR